MNLTYQFRRLMFAQILLGIVAFCIAARNPGMLLVAGAVAALSWYVTEGPSGRPLPTAVTNIVALVALFWLLVQLLLYHSGLLAELVVAMGNFVMWVQIVLLYREKTNREYGEILVLSAVLMVAASILSVSIVYGLLLALYCVLALATSLMYQLKRTSDAVQHANQHAAPAGQRAASPEAVVGRGHRWQFRTMGMSVGMICALVAVMVFVLMPRREQASLASSQMDARFESRRQVGFTDHVSLGRGVGSDAGGSTAVLNFALTEAGENLGGPKRSFLLRGAAMDEYNKRTHTWQRSRSAAARDYATTLNPQYADMPRQPAVTLAQVPDDVPLRKAEITLRRGGDDVLFAPYPTPIWLWSESIDRIEFNALDQRLSADVENSASTYRLHMPRSPLTKMRQRYEQVLHDDDGRFHSMRDYMRRLRSNKQYARGWPVQPKRVREYAMSILAEQNLSRDPEARHTPQDGEIASALAQHLAEEFRYTLENPPVDPDQDPVIDFLFNEQSGHCELFAAAHAAMCRSIGIATRIVTGYLATEYNDLGDYYIVRQKNAHAWTEVDLGPDIGWQHFDPTPSAEVSAEHAPATGWLHEIQQVYDYVESSWIAWIVAYDQQARTALLDEVKSSVTQPAQNSEHWLGNLVDRIKRLPEFWRFDYLTYTIAAIIMIAIGLGVGILARTLIIRRRRMAALQLTALPRARRRSLARRLRFYIYMLEILERYGYFRPYWQSPQAFAQELAEANPLRFDPVVSLTEVFYEVRFGYREIDDDRRQRIRAHLRQLEHALAETRG